MKNEWGDSKKNNMSAHLITLQFKISDKYPKAEATEKQIFCFTYFIAGKSKKRDLKGAREIQNLNSVCIV